MCLRTRFEEKYTPEPNSGCWLWTAAITGGGYGKMGVDGKTKAAHRISYELNKGPIPDGLEIDHLCRVRCCVNPDHLEAVTHSENAKRGLQGEYTAKKMLAKTHCPQGHEYTRDNTIVRGTSRSCKACQRRYIAKWREANPNHQRNWRAKNPDRIAAYEARRDRRREVCYRTF